MKKYNLQLSTSLFALAALIGGQTFANTPVTGAAFTTINEDIDGIDHCKNGNPNVNCNIYDGKEYVWLSGGPSAAALGDGVYFFAVLVPSGQGGNQNPNDGTPNNLSDITPTSNTGAGDAYTNRIFTISGGSITYNGTHDFDNNKIRLMGYDDTTNNGGVYILAICNLADVYPVDPSDCKYDAFKIQEGDQVTPSDLTIIKTADGTFDRTFGWDILKEVDNTLVKQVGGSATFNYTVTVTHDDGTEGNWAVSGKITVTNLNLFDVNNVDVTDSINDANADCTVTGGEDATIPAASSVEFDYACSFSQAPANKTETNTAVVNWPQTTSGNTTLAAGSATYDIDFTFVENHIDECVDVDDTYAGYLGDVCVGDENPKEFTYDRTIDIPANGCLTYDNTATFTTNDTAVTDSADKSVEVCGPEDTGALTIGFWQNKNGQSIITSYCGGTSGTSLDTFLDAYNPFTDADATTCVNEAKYVYDVIKAANAKGASMNAMLKAQMLATALNVYFSDPLLGGNQIGAPAPIGGVSVDLTLICTDLTCTAFEDSSSVFGGSPKTVLEMLSYAASQSNIGGTDWYGQEKATQELAKDAFDAINNEKVFGP